MFTSKLSTVEANILSHNFIPDNVRPLVARRTEDGKTFGKLEIIASPPDLVPISDKYPPRNLIAGFLLDTSGSMDGKKIIQAVNTIKQLAQTILEERNGKTLEHQPIHAWIYVISFDSTATIRIPFQEITEETLPGIISELDTIRVNGCTNYEVAFKKQTEVISEIILPFIASDPEQRQFHVARFFETDGEITQGSRDIRWLYDAMRTTTATTDTDAATDTDADTVSDPQHRHHHNVTFEDYVIGYDTGIDLKCLKELASPTPPPSKAPEQHSDECYNCSSLITVVRAEDIGWQVGEILYKQIMRVGIKLTVSVESKNPAEGVTELFEYQTNQWSNATTFHSIIHNERKALYVQFTPAAAATAATAATQPEIIVRVQCENQITGAKYTYEFFHQSASSSSLTPLLLRTYDSLTLTERGLACTESDGAIQAVIPIIQAMIHIEIFKQFRELEGDNYDKDVIVREAYNTLRMLKAIGAKTNERFIHSIAPKTANMITDVKLIIGLTAINNVTEQHCIIHARRTASAEEDMFNTGVTASRKYVEDEEDHEPVAREIVERHQGMRQQQQQQHQQDQEEEYDEVASDCIPSRIATCMSPSPTTNNSHHHHHHRHKVQRNPSLVRLLCARIALSKLNNQDRTPQSIYDEMILESVHYGGEYNEDPSYFHTHHGPQDDVFSTPSQDDEYTQRRMGMMRQMSSPSSS
jgi:hypothetical protein